MSPSKMIVSSSLILTMKEDGVCT